MKTIQVKQPGLLTTIQDLGRWGFGRFGMPVAGVMDEHATRLLNILLSNADNAPVLEMTLMGPNLVFDGDITFAIGGANLQPRLNDRVIELWTVQQAKAGDRLQFVGSVNGCRAYLAVEGGFKVEQIMGSASTYLRGKLGGHAGRALQKGDALTCGIQPSASQRPGISIPQESRPEYRNSIRVILGPQDDAFTAQGLNTFFSSEYRVSNEADRMGYRLEGPKIEHKDSADIISDGIALGAIQVPAHGRPIIMLADRQTTGGYTKIANVISVDIPSIAQLKPGDSLTFEEVSIEAAQQLYRKRATQITQFKRFVQQSQQSKPAIESHYTVSINGRKYQVSVQEIM
jgi:antagonist of KipI